MRLWSIHPKYLDTKRLVAAWREGLLARAVLLGKTKGYKNHPQLNRFKGKSIEYIDTYLFNICSEAERRGYSFDKSKIDIVDKKISIDVNSDQVYYELRLLEFKLNKQIILNGDFPDVNPIFRLVNGPIEPWEKVRSFI